MKKDLLVIIVLVLVSVCNATTRTVCSSGCNYTTIQAGVDAASTRDTVYVYNGTYYEHLTIDKPLNLEGENKNCTIIDGSQSSTCLTIDQNSHYTNVSGFTFQRCDTNVYFYYNENSTLKDSIIRESTGDSILLTHSSGNTISNNTIYVPNGRYGIYLDNADDNLIESNIITENPSRAIVIYASSKNQIIRNTITREHSPGSTYSGIRVWDHSSTNNNFSENDIINFTYGIYLDQGGSQYIYNNTILHSVNHGLFANPEAGSNSIINNNFRYSGIYDIQLLSGSNTIVNNSVCKIYYMETTTIQDNICPYSTPPNIQLQSPDNASLSFNRNNTFKFIAFDDFDDLFNCYFYIGSYLVAGKTVLNNTLGEFNYTDMGDNPYTWHIMCNDSDGNNASSEERILEVNVYPPSISNIAPYDGHHTSNNLINITYYTSDYWNISNCSLYGNFTGVWKLNSTDFEVESGRYNSFIVTLDEGEYLWGITCYDGRDLSTITPNKTLYVDNTPPVISLVNITPSLVDHDSAFSVYVNVTDELSNITSVYINAVDVWSGQMGYLSGLYLTMGLDTPDLPGKYEINITATDSAGNLQNVIYDYTVRFGTISIDCGSGNDYQSNTSRGYGYLDGSALDNVRYDTDGNVSYLFTLLRPSDSYFFTLKFTDAFSEGGVQTIYFDNQYSGFNVTLSGTQYVYITPDSALYEDNDLMLTIKRSSIGRTLIDEIEMRRFDPIPNISIDSGSLNDLQYSSSRDYGYLDGSSYTAWGNQSYQTVRYDTDGIVRYQFDNLDQRENYSLNLTFYEGDGAGRIQTAYVDESNGSDPSVNLSDGLIHHIYFDISKDKYYDQSIILYVERAGSGDAIISYLDLISTYTLPTTTSTTTTSTSTTSTSSTTTSLPIDECPKGDTPPCDGLVDDYELLDYIDLWTGGEVTDYDLLEAIDNWAG